MYVFIYIYIYIHILIICTFAYKCKHKPYTLPAVEMVPRKQQKASEAAKKNKSKRPDLGLVLRHQSCKQVAELLHLWGSRGCRV